MGVRETRRASQRDAPRSSNEGASHDEEGSGLIVVLDTGGVDALAPLDERRRARLRVLRARATDIVVPAAVLAEGLLTGHRGHDYQVRRLLEVVDIVDVDERLGHDAGALRHEAISAGMNPSGVDAIVAAEADLLAARDEVHILTSDAHDFEMLASLAGRADRLSIVVV